LLQGRKLFSPARLYAWATIQITREVEDELIHFGCQSWIKNKTHIVPIRDEKIYKDAIESGFDPADASILSLGVKDNFESFIISEDRPLLDYARMVGFVAGLLVDFFRVCDAMDWMTHRELYQLAKALYQLTNISKKKYKGILAWRARH